MLEKYYRINQVAGVTIDLLTEGNVAISACRIVAKDNQLEIVQKVTDLDSVEALQRQLPAKTVIALNLVGKGILYRQVERVAEITRDNFNKVLPNANFDDFYIQNFISGALSFISVIRKAEADKWISKLAAFSFEPLAISLGPFPVQHVLTQLNFYGSDVAFNGHVIVRDEKFEWTAYRNDPKALSPFALKIESEVIHEKLVIPYAAAFQLVLAANLDFISAPVPALDAAFQEKINDNKLKVKGFLILVALFLLLLINFFVFAWLNSANSKLTDQVSRSAQSSTDIEQVNEQVQQKELMLKTLGWEDGISKSRLIDQLAAVLPAEISWKSVTVDPVDLPSSRLQKSVVFSERKIKVVGNSARIIPVNEWIARIKTRHWVKNVQLDNYTIDNESNTGQFTIIIDY